MEEDKENLISKRQLLAKYAISYGALYRWKRKGLIPEDWFIKKSTVTGQETFFPKELICERIELILNTKDELLLDELASRLSGAEEEKEALVVTAAFGEKKFYLSDIRSVSLIHGNGEIKEITALIKQLFSDNGDSKN